MDNESTSYLFKYGCFIISILLFVCVKISGGSLWAFVVFGFVLTTFGCISCIKLFCIPFEEDTEEQDTREEDTGAVNDNTNQLSTVPNLNFQNQSCFEQIRVLILLPNSGTEDQGQNEIDSPLKPDDQYEILTNNDLPPSYEEATSSHQK